MHRSVRILSAVALGYLPTACSDSTGLNSGQGSVSFQLASKAAVAPSTRVGGPSFSVAAAPDTLSLGGNVLVITQAELVLKQIELERQSASNCETLFNESECDELQAGPMLVDLPLAAGATQSFNVAADTGVYTKLHIHVHKVSGTDSTDQAFLAANPGFDGTSIRVTGTYNGTPFTYTTDLDAEQEIDPGPKSRQDKSRVKPRLSGVLPAPLLHTPPGSGPQGSRAGGAHCNRSATLRSPLWRARST